MPFSEEQINELMADDMLPEYDVEADVAAVFTTLEAVNAVLRALIQTMPSRLQGDSA